MVRMTGRKNEIRAPVIRTPMDIKLKAPFSVYKPFKA